MKAVGAMQVGLLGLVLLAGAAWTATDEDGFTGLRVGIRGGGILPSTDLSGKLNWHSAAFLRYVPTEKWQLEMNVGYGVFTTEDSTWTLVDAAANKWTVSPAKRNYDTNLSFAQFRLLYAPVLYEKWNPYLYAGAGYTYFNVGPYRDNEDMTPRRGTFDGTDNTLGLPLGLGVRYRLAKRWGLEVSGGYTFTFSDRIDEKKDGGKKDHYWEMTAGLTYDIPFAKAEKPVAPPPVVEVPKDSDGDGLTDDEEVNIYHTDPFNPDTDGDGLNDGQEVKVYRTDPLNPDTDGGSVGDGIEVKRGTNPLDPSDDVAKIEQREIERPVALPMVYFAFDSSALSPAAKQELDKAAQVLIQNKDLSVNVRGHADISGTPPYNLRLSRQRADAVRNYLVQRGVAASQLTTVGLGDTQPAAPNNTREGRQKNRRVELVPAR